MLKTFLGRSAGSRDVEDSSTEGASDQWIDLDRLQTLVEFFSIGKKLRYYPEFKKEVVFDTLIVAYCVNGDFIYSGERIDRDSQGGPTGFRTGEKEQRVPVAKLKRFQLLVPDTSDLELMLDYQRRALIGRGKQFSKGNNITLISNAGVKGMSTIDNEVARQLVLPDGPYAQSKMILLTPDLRTLVVTDQRRKPRARGCAPVTLFWQEKALSGPCTIVDMSEEAVRVRVRDRNSPMPAMNTGDDVTLDIDLGDADRHYVVKGAVFRRSSEACVIRLKGLVRDGKNIAFGQLDLLELKAALLNYGE